MQDGNTVSRTAIGRSAQEMITSPNALITGWDVGGAHLKLAQADAAGNIVAAVQIPCPLWQGLDRLTSAIEAAGSEIVASPRHAVTMTGELVDLFADRAEGVRRLIATLAAALPDAALEIYAGRAGFLAPEAAVPRWQEVASANWLASVRLAAARLPEGLFIDIGSTTTDVVPFRHGADLALGLTDAERLASDELVYTGITRTPVMALADSVPFAGQWQGVMAEHFATLADVYRLTGALPEGADQHPTADGRDKSPEASRRRLARMLGRDAEEASPAAWRALATHLADRQRGRIAAAVTRVQSRGLIGAEAPLVGAGIGRFVVRRLAEESGRPYEDFGALLGGQAEAREAAVCCAPAAAVALLAMAEA